MLTVAMVAETVPRSLRTAVTQSLVDRVNSMDEDPNTAAAMRENFLTYTSVLQDGKFRVEDYLNAVKFVSLLLMKYSKRDAWIRTFPERHQELLAKGADKKTISSHVAMYAGGKLVNLILERSLVPFHVLNQDLRQRALEKQARLMMTAHSELVQMQAANSVLQHTAPPKEVVAAQLNVNIGATSSLRSLEATLAQLAVQQKKMIEQGGITTKLIAESAIVDAEIGPAE